MRIRAVIVLTLIVFAGCQSARNSALDSKCRELGADRTEHLKKDSPYDYLALKTSSFYSKTLDSCIYTESPETGTSVVEFNIRDLTHSLLKDTRLDLLLHCDKDGADSVIVDKVRAYGGYTWDVTYTQWLDDGFGGPPRTTAKTPNRPYTQKQCERVFEKWMEFLK